MTQHPELFAALAEPFHPEEVKILTKAGRNLSYVTARSIMNRLDTVLGPENWQDEYRPGGQNCVVCRLTITLPDGRTVAKEDAGGAADMADPGDNEKSGYSDAFKRAAVKHGVSRYLYKDGIPNFGQQDYQEPEPEPRRAEPPPRQDPPARRQEAAPAQQSRPPQNGHQQPQQQLQRQQQSAPPQGGGGRANAPRSGKALFAYVKEMEQKHEIGLLKYLNGFMKLQDFPGRMVDLDADQVNLCYQEAERKIAALSRGDAYEEPMTN